MLTPMILASLLALAASTAHAAEASAEPEGGIAVMCDPVKYRFSIRADATATDLDPSYPIRKLIPVEALFDPHGMPGWTGEIELLAPLVRYERCGPYTFKFEGDAYNLYTQGEAGAYPPFVALTIFRGNSIIFPRAKGPLRLTECDRTVFRAEPCPIGYAVRLDGSYDDRRKALHLTVTSSSIQDEDEDQRKTAVEQLDLKDDLEMWHPDLAVRPPHVHIAPSPSPARTVRGAAVQNGRE